MQYMIPLLSSHHWTGYPWGLVAYKPEVLMGEGEEDASSLFPAQRSREGVGWADDHAALVWGWRR